MLTVNVQYPDREPVVRKFPALPRTGDFLDLDDGLFRVDAVVFRDASSTWGDVRPTVYAAAVGSERAKELRTAWRQQEIGGRSKKMNVESVNR